jgi:opine dehydrogenase
MNIAILGGGNGCYAAAADLAQAGHSVRLWRRDAAALKAVIDAGSIELKDADGARDVAIALASADIAAVLRDAQLVVIPSPAVAQVDVARQIAPHLQGGQVVFLPPGTFGSFAMSRLVRQAGSRADVAWAETARCRTWRASTVNARSTSPCGRCGCPPACTRRARPTRRCR